MPKNLGNIPSGDCSYCGEDFLHCHCEQFHPNVLTSVSEQVLPLNRREVLELMRFLMPQYIDHDDFVEVHSLINRMHRFLK